ncbi:MAG: M20/M25/M40 family metallo-hydrolase [Oscillospiraceae bacterium]
MIINEKRLIDRFCEYVKINSESGNEKAFYNRLLKDVKEIGFTPKTDDCGGKCGSNANNIYAYLDGDKTSCPRFLAFHMDTVPTGGKIVPVVGKEEITSDGTTILSADDKGAIAAFFEAVCILRENNIPHIPIEVVFTIGEEQGLIGAKNFDIGILKSKKGLVFDISKPTNFIVSHSPYKTKFDVIINGKSAHAGINPQDGVSAAMIFADAVKDMKLLRVDDETTANIGCIHGGTGSNVVMSQLVVGCEVRSISRKKHDDQLSHMIDCFKNSAKMLGGNAEIKITNQYNGYIIDRESENLKIVSDIITSLGKDVQFISSGGGSDANIFISKGLDVLNIGTGMENIHGNNETQNINELKLMVEIICRYLSK